MFLDASKVFDRINHWTVRCLFKKLLDRKTNLLFVRLLIFWYCSQTMCIKWASNLSPFFCVTNGVRQGGIMSPLLFNVYMDDLSHVLNRMQYGCCINGMKVNHLMYADDACIIGPSPLALQKLLDVCQSFATQNSIVYNDKK